MQQEVRKLEIENHRAESWVGTGLAAAPFITALVGIATLGAAIAKQQNENRRQHQELETQRAAEAAARGEQHAREIQQRDRELRQRFDEQFTLAMINVGSDSLGLQAAGAASLLRLQEGANEKLQQEILLYCATQLRLDVGQKVRPILKEVLQKAMSVLFCARPPSLVIPALSLAGADLRGVNLSGVSVRHIKLDLTGADLTGALLVQADLWHVSAPGVILEGADCTKTNFGPANLTGSHCRGATFRGARCGSANLDWADLTDADLTGAELQAAHFNHAVLLNTDFSHANINEAYFIDARIDEKTALSLARAKNKSRAHPPQLGNRRANASN